MVRLIPLLAAVLFATAAHAAGARPDGADRDDTVTAPAALGAATAEAEGRNGFVLPFVFYTPDTRFGLGGTAGLHLHLRDAPRPSSLFATGIYTLEGQSALDLVAQIYPDARHAIQVTARATHFPTAYYGLGPDSRRADREWFTQRFAELALAGERHLAAGLRAGPRLHLRAEELSELEPGGALAGGTLPGVDGFIALGAGAGITWDDRDGLFAPTRGRFAELSYVAYPGHVGGHAPFGRAALDLRAFTSPHPGHVLGAQAYAEVAHGDVPVTLLPRFGGAHRMRGYGEGRYRDRVHYALQGEYRFPIFRRLGGAAFATAGDVAPRLSAIDLGDVKLSAGAGLRFQLTKEGAALRFDVAGARDGMSYYAVVLQAF
jgi:hypothetical protein